MHNMSVTLVDHMGSDLSVVNAARVSFSKTSQWETIPEAGPTPGLLKEGDEKLIKYLAKHDHWSPFGHGSLQFHIKAPVFVARQLVKHQVGLVWNEVSRRYVDDEVEFYQPEEWRGRPTNSKQGSSDDYNQVIKSAQWTYKHLIEIGVAPEQARMVLPLSHMTEWYWSGTLMAFARVCNLRCKSDTQLETQMVANQIDKLAEEKFPYSWEALRDG